VCPLLFSNLPLGRYHGYLFPVVAVLISGACDRVSSDRILTRPKANVAGAVQDPQCMLQPAMTSCLVERCFFHTNASSRNPSLSGSSAIKRCLLSFTARQFRLLPGSRCGAPSSLMGNDGSAEILRPQIFGFGVSFCAAIGSKLRAVLLQ
jgi:hypothetical protein